MNKNQTHIAFLRGINVGGNKKVPMSELKSLFESKGFTDVVTILNSGNIIFKTNQSNLEKLIEKTIKNHFDFEVPTQIISVEDLNKIINSNPFKNQVENKNIKCYISFIKNKKPIFNTVDLSKEGTLDLMVKLDKEYGKEITTRNWNTIERIAKKLD